MAKTDSTFSITEETAGNIAREIYDLTGVIKTLPGELDYNFRVTTESEHYILKVSQPNADIEFIEFQDALLQHVSNDDDIELSPVLIPTKDGLRTMPFTDSKGNIRVVRLLSWVDGRLWSEVKPISDALLASLGQKAGSLTSALQSFEHPLAHRDFEWDVAKVEWVKDFLHLFSSDEKKVVTSFLALFETQKERYQSLPKSVVHNDANDNNVVVSADLINPEVLAIIDFGDAVYTQTINDLAITVAYAAMHKHDPITAAAAVVRGYNQAYKLSDEEIRLLYVLIAARLIISVTKSAINKQKEPDNKYLLISESPAWELLYKWIEIDQNMAYYSFREACHLRPHPHEEQFFDWANKQSFQLKDLIPEANNETVVSPDFSVGSRWVGTVSEQDDIALLSHKLKQLQLEQKGATLAGGYGEIRSIYSTDSYKIETNNGPQYRTVHLGVDFWFTAGTEVRALLNGKVFSIIDNNNPKDYGPTLILQHTEGELNFYTLYGHLSKSSLALLKPGTIVNAGDLIGYLGKANENGGWSPHLHFQVILDLLGNKSDFPGVAIYHNQTIWQSLCPDPGLLFQSVIPGPEKNNQELHTYRKNHLGKSLSLSYNEPLTILRGSGAWLIDKTGRRYLDTVNNVAHVGHEHPAVVKAGQEQMAVLNTNTRYLNQNINSFAQELLSSFPPELSVVHFVNSGSEANELALRMAKAYTGQKDILAMEVGYHGNTSGCIDVSSYKFDGKGGSGAPPHTHIIPLPDSFRGLYQGENTGPQYADHVEKLIAHINSSGRGVAGFICESIISCGGQIELPEGFLKLAFEAVHAAGGLCIADEVQVGCGRVGSKFWGFQLHDVAPDIVTIGKPIGNGHPLAAVVCTQRVADAFANGMEYFNTFGGNPVSSSIGKTVLDVVKNEGLQNNALKVGNYLKESLLELQKEFSIIGDVRGQGLFLGFELNAKDKSPLKEQATYLANRMKELGILISTDGPDENVIKIKPPMVFSKANSQELIYRLTQVFEEDFMKL